MPMKLECTTEEFLAELQRQSAQAEVLVSGLNEAALNCQMHGGKSWSVGQCLEHLVIMNAIYVKALRQLVESNRDQLGPRKNPMQPSGWLTRLFLRSEEPPPKLKLPAPCKISPPSQITSACRPSCKAGSSRASTL